MGEVVLRGQSQSGCPAPSSSLLYSSGVNMAVYSKVIRSASKTISRPDRVESSECLMLKLIRIFDFPAEGPDLGKIVAGHVVTEHAVTKHAATEHRLSHHRIFLLVYLFLHDPLDPQPGSQQVIWICAVKISCGSQQADIG